MFFLGFFFHPKRFLPIPIGQSTMIRVDITFGDVVEWYRRYI